MTIVSPNVRRGTSLAAGGVVIAASTLLIAAPTASAEPSGDAVDAIDSRYATFGGESSLLGAPVEEAVDVPGGAAREYEGGTIYFSEDTGAHVMYGAILDRYTSLGGPGSDLGFPKNDESDTGDGAGRFSDLSAPGGASIYWTPQWGAWVIKGRVLEAWRQSGGVTGPFGYPGTDTSIVDGVQTSTFVGPDGTEIQWSPAAGLVTIPAELAATIPGFGTATPTAEGTSSVTKPTASTPAAPEIATKNTKWWWIPVGLVAAALLLGLVRLLRRKPKAVKPVKPVTATATARKRTPPPAPAPTPRPVVQTPPPAPTPPPRPPAPAPVPPAAPRPPAAPPAPPIAPFATPAPAAPAPTPRPAAPMPTPPPAAPMPVPPPPPPPAPPRPAPLLSEPPTATITAASADQDASPVIKYASAAPADTSIQITYENNAVDGEASHADKSDLTLDPLQE